MMWIHPTTPQGATAQEQAECDCPNPEVCCEFGCDFTSHADDLLAEVDAMSPEARQRGAERLMEAIRLGPDVDHPDDVRVLDKAANELPS